MTSQGNKNMENTNTITEENPYKPAPSDRPKTRQPSNLSLFFTGLFSLFSGAGLKRVVVSLSGLIVLSMFLVKLMVHRGRVEAGLAKASERKPFVPYIFGGSSEESVLCCILFGSCCVLQLFALIVALLYPLS